MHIQNQKKLCRHLIKQICIENIPLQEVVDFYEKACQAEEDWDAKTGVLFPKELVTMKFAPELLATWEEVCKEFQKRSEKGLKTFLQEQAKNQRALH